MKNTKQDALWTGKPAYVFKITLLESDSYHDPMMGFASPLTLYIVIVGILVVLFQVLFQVSLSIAPIAVLLMGGLVVPDIFIWSRKSRMSYKITPIKLLIMQDNEVSKEVALDSILNTYTTNDSSKLESIVITYKEPIEEKIEKVKVYQIPKADNISQLLSGK